MSPDMTGRTVAAWGTLGLLVWTLTEYCLHRFAFHYEASSKFGKRLHFIVHGVHHDDPNDPSRLVMPPAVSLLIGAAMMPIFYFACGPIYCLPFTFGFIWGYLGYDFIHYYTHHFTPRTAIGRYLKQSHMLHHFQDPTTRMGVSSPLWDFVFGTMGKVKAYRPTSK
jgi:sterol desaturase/sphingolipid hydroxylase (fatty acid hydroxylase superfamily)